MFIWHATRLFSDSFLKNFEAIHVTDVVDLSMYKAEALDARKALREDEEVITKIGEIWHYVPKDAQHQQNQDSYIQVCFGLVKVNACLS